MNKKLDVSCLQGKTVILPGGHDKDDHPLLLVNVSPDAPVEIETPLQYLLSLFSESSQTRGITVIIDARKSPWKVARSTIKQVTNVFNGEGSAKLIVLRPDAFWDKQRVESCTNVQYDGQVVFIPRSRLNKFVDLSQLPQELGGNFIYDHEQWTENRRRVEDFYTDSDITMKELEELHQYLQICKKLRRNEVGAALNTSSEMIESARMLVLNVTELGRQLLQTIEYNNRIRKFASEFGSMSTPQEILDTFDKIDEILTTTRRKQQLVDEAFAELERSFIDTKDLSILEDGVVRVTNWILGPAEALLNTRQGVGFDVSSAEELRREHAVIELKCLDAYGTYAELRYKIENYSKMGPVSMQQKDLVSQKEFMDFVCRSFASRLERRRNVLITSLRFFRLVAEYFDKTGEVFDSLVMGNANVEFSTAEQNLKQLQESQVYLDGVKRELVREGEKLSDMLSMPVKDALGREITVDYTENIINIRDILDATTARRNIFSDSVELQKLTLEQICHINNYEKDVVQAIQWLDELFQVLMRDHAHVGCTVYEIQAQKYEHQTFQETAKDTYNYGCQLLSASLALRQSCKLPTDEHDRLSKDLEAAWQRLFTVSQEQMTRLRVSAVFHRSIEEHCNQLRDLREAVATIPLMDMSRKRARVRHYFCLREKLLVEVGRMVRLGRLLKSRLKEALFCSETLSEHSTSPSTESDRQSEDSQSYTGDNEIAIEAICERLTEITDLVEELEQAFQSAQQDCSLILTSPTHSSKSDPVGSADSSPNSSMDSNIPIPTIEIKPPRADDTRSDEEFLTASECTQQHSRSSSYNTASECEHRYSPWWECDKNANEDLYREKMVLGVGLPELPPTKEVLKPSPEVPPGKIVHEVTETTHIKVQHQHTMGVSSFVLTSETVKDKTDDGKLEELGRMSEMRVREPVIKFNQENGTDGTDVVNDEEFSRRMKEVSGRFEDDAWRKYHSVTKQAIKGFV